MIGKFKAAVLAAFAVLALGALGAAGASAAEFTSSFYPVVVEGEQPAGENHTFGFQGREATCDTAHFVSEEQAEASSELTVEPTYSDCHTVILGIKLPTTVTFGGCDYKFTAAAPTEEAQVHIGCTGENTVQIHVYNPTGGHSSENEVCTYTAQPQAVGGAIEYHNNANGSVTITTGMSIAITRVHGGLLTCGSATGTLVYQGRTTMSGSEGQSIDIG